MTFKYLLSRAATLFSIILLTTTTLEAYGGSRFFNYLYLVIAIIPLFVFGYLFFLFTRKKGERLFFALQFFVIVLFSYLFVPEILRYLFTPKILRFLPIQLKTIVIFSIILLQILAWVFLFRKDGWKTVLILSIFSILYPIFLFLWLALFVFLVNWF